MQGPTLRDVAKAAGVHTATASRALNPNARALVNPETARRVLRAAETLGYRPNPIARSLKTAKYPHRQYRRPARTRAGADHLAALAPGRRSDHCHRAAETSAAATVARAARADGAGHRRTEELAGGSVAADDAAGIGLAVKHLVELGHRRILHLAGPQTNSTGVERLRAFRTAAREHEALRATCSTPPLTGAPATVLVLMPPGTAAIPTHRAPPTEPVRALPGRRFASADARPRADECSRSPPR
ncbi:LacI family transcriptional regulator [Nocardia vinacea]|nr:LacI family transcriptional regulator [Nocardia vinacea]